MFCLFIKSSSFELDLYFKGGPFEMQRYCNQTHYLKKLVPIFEESLKSSDKRLVLYI